MSISKCLKFAKIGSEDAAEIREFIRKYKDQSAGAQAYINNLEDDLNDLRMQLVEQGFDVDVKIFRAPKKVGQKMVIHKPLKKSMAGVKAKSADLTALGKAIKMSDEGTVSKNIIREETGWFIGMDKKWRFEIDDSKASLKGPWSRLTGKDHKIGNVIKHDELFNAYPELKNITLKRVNFRESIRGVFNPDAQMLRIASGLSDTEALSTILHEMQHWVQFKEGFARGGSPSAVSISKSIDKLERHYKKDLDEKLKNLGEEPDFSEFEKWRKWNDQNNRVAIAKEKLDTIDLYKKSDVEKISKEIKDLLSEADEIDKKLKEKEKELRDLVGKSYDEIEDLIDKSSKVKQDALKNKGWSEYKKISSEEDTTVERKMGVIQNNINKMQRQTSEISNKRQASQVITKLKKITLEKEISKKLKPFKSLAFDAYRMIAGEIEARAVQARATMTKEERRTKHPYVSEGIAEEDAIVRFDKDIMKSLEEPTLKFSKKTEEINKKYFGPAKTNIIKLKDAIANKPIKTFFKWIRTYGIDRLAPIRELGTETYMMSRLQGNVPSQMAAFLQHGKFKWLGNALSVEKDPAGGFLAWYNGLKKDGPKFLQWLAARRATELSIPTEEFPEGRENYLDAESRKEIFDSTWSIDDQIPLKMNEKFKEFNDNILDMAQEAGVINKEGRSQWAQEFYIPFYRLLNEETDLTDQEILGAPYKIKRHITSGIKKLKGGESRIGDLMENTLHNWAHLINESMRNQSRRHAFESGKRLGIIKRVPKKYIKMKDRRTLSFLRNGEPIYFQVKDTELFNALSEFNHQHLDGMLAQLFGNARRVLTWGVTMGPAFRIANFLRDTLSTAVISKEFTPFIDSFRGMYKIITKHPDFISYAGSGGAFTQGYIRGQDPKAQAKYINDLSKKPGIGLTKIYDAWQYIGDVFEMSARVQLYSNVKKVSGSHLKASYAAKDILDFSMKGAGKAMTSVTNMIPFMNARIQGMYKLGRGAKHQPAAFLLKGALLTVASMALWSAFKDDDRYKKLPDEEKWMYHHAWLGDQHIRIPKAFEVGLMFSSIFEEAGNIINETEDGKHIMDFMGHAFRETLAMEYIPQAVKPLFEVYTNRNTFTGAPIETMGISKRTPGLRYDPWTPESMKALGKKLNVSPNKAYHLIRGYFGAFGAGMVMSADIAYSFVADLPDRPTATIEQYPMVGRFIRGEREKRTKYAARVWNIYEKLEQANIDLNFYRKNGMKDMYKKLKKDKRKELRTYKSLKPYKKRLDDLRRKISKIWISDLTGDRKRDALIKLENKRNDIHKRMYDRIEKNLQ